jgi:hypothetical protein
MGRTGGEIKNKIPVEHNYTVKEVTRKIYTKWFLVSMSLARTIAEFSLKHFFFHNDL